MKKGLFITLEGGEGAGKSTQAKRIHAWLEERGHDVCLTRQPGGTPLAETLREVVLDPVHAPISPTAELLLLFAGRAQFISDVVRPSLESGKTILCDRFTDSTRAYQGGGRGLPGEQIEAVAQMVHGDIQPDLTLLFDLPIEQGRARAENRSAADRIEQEQKDFFERVRQAYLNLADNEPDRFVILDASGSEQAVWQQIKDVLEARVSK